MDSAKTTPPIRLWQTATEKNLADEIFKYIPTQTMTLSDLELMRKVSDLNDTLEKEKDYIFMSMDFVCWCLSIGICLATPLFHEIDSLFGLMNAYKYTHVFPHECLIIFQDRYRPPDGYDEPFETLLATFMGKKWMEGMRQKSWTILTKLEKALHRTEGWTYEEILICFYIYIYRYFFIFGR